ncbi:amphi-Trp domain-containing protein [Halodesulfovibrio spirochaetisodalis]|uniref:Amphi-Trp domain-containing protein n=1 Tax=Halodesulfovibrio spirochaetisodalis TaxID=1560234 RepID=A0A1B7XB54_9BACT|nr:amphi-Trp domain-containing protein [Halodesulfovibrio spirochaetisodalis]OBQ46530.1 hypothetical protein SP90_12140 [Halodesulfovibrio spirochaetisodalis]
MEKKKIHISDTIPCKLAVSHIDCFLDGLRSGAVVIEEGDKKIILHPHSEVKMDIEAKAKKDKQRLVITLEWCAPEACQRIHHETHTPHAQEHGGNGKMLAHHHRGGHHHDEEYDGHHSGHHQEPPHKLDEHGFHSHHHCHGKGEHQLCHTHEHAEGHHEHQQQTGCCEDIEHEAHEGCCSEHNYGRAPHWDEVPEHGHHGCCEGKKHSPHKGCCSEHDYGMNIEEHGRRNRGQMKAERAEILGETLHGNGYKIWHKGHSAYFDHKHHPPYATHKMFHGTQTHHKPRGKGENYHRKSHTSVPPRPEKTT